MIASKIFGKILIKIKTRLNMVYDACQKMFKNRQYIEEIYYTKLVM